ncbi:GNAT family N-acetyltransferase [Heyndrickxia sp. FSL K6-6286]|jgi:RimJ/RimL family protein N-acetyltransferase|uniref:GNAT family N-acetyltransferase n=1 Tax=Heyndrickxia TaxID=2837504 RepID=UPI00217F11B0|nr:GNAT family N-acetyltransferase [Heyndrickxia oleronia]
MIYEVKGEQRKNLSSLFASMDSTIILSALQGHMGTVWVDDLENPTAAQVTVGIFVFYAGNPSSKGAEELLYNLPDFTLAIVETDEWKSLIEEVHNGRFEKFQRYQFIKNLEHLDIRYIEELSNAVPKGYELVKIDATIAKYSSLHKLSEDFISQFDSLADFIDRGIGFAVLKNGKVVCGATSFSIYDEGIEIEIATHPEYRRKGLATITAAALIKECLERGLYPSWDGANIESVKLAQKLGYRLKGSYDTYFIDK